MPAGGQPLQGEDEKEEEVNDLEKQVAGLTAKLNELKRRNERLELRNGELCAEVNRLEGDLRRARGGEDA